MAMRILKWDTGMPPDHAFEIHRRQAGWAWSILDVEGKPTRSGVSNTEALAWRELHRVAGFTSRIPAAKPSSTTAAVRAETAPSPFGKPQI